MRRRLVEILLGLSLLLSANQVRADACIGGGNRPEPRRDGAVGSENHSQRRLGMGLLAAASVTTLWLSLRRSGKG